MLYLRVRFHEPNINFLLHTVKALIVPPGELMFKPSLEGGSIRDGGSIREGGIIFRPFARGGGLYISTFFGILPNKICFFPKKFHPIFGLSG